MDFDQQEFLKPEFIIDILLKRRWILIVPLILALAAGSYLAITLPKIYEAKTLILIQPQKVPTQYVQSLVSSDIDERISTLSQQILSRTNLEKIIRDLDLFSGPGSAGLYMEDKVASLRKNISVEITRSRRETNSFSITFKGKDPETIMKVTNALATYFIDENIKVREAQAIGTSDFLDDELEAMRVRLEEKEGALETYKTQFMGELPEQLETNLRILDRLQEQMSESQEGLRDAKSRLVSLQNQASSGFLSVSRDGDTEPDPLDLNSLQAELARLQSRYTARHPDIIKLKSRITELEQNQDSSRSGQSQSTAQEPVEITDVKREIYIFESEAQRLLTQIRQYESRVESTPRREQELLALQRDYRNLQDSYSSLLSRKLEAEIAVNMERKQKGEQFRILDRASVPKRPVEPNMKKLFLMTIAGGFGVGGAIVFLLEILNSTFRSPKEIETLLGLPTLAMIPFIEDRKTLILKKVNLRATILALGISAMLFLFFTSLTLNGVESTLGIVSKAKDMVF